MNCLPTLVAVAGQRQLFILVEVSMTDRKESAFTLNLRAGMHTQPSLSVPQLCPITLTV